MPFDFLSPDEKPFNPIRKDSVMKFPYNYSNPVAADAPLDLHRLMSRSSPGREPGATDGKAAPVMGGNAGRWFGREGRTAAAWLSATIAVAAVFGGLIWLVQTPPPF